MMAKLGPTGVGSRRSVRFGRSGSDACGGTDGEAARDCPRTSRTARTGWRGSAGLSALASPLASSALRCDEPCPGASGRTRRGLAGVQRAGAPGRGRRRAGHGRPAQRPDRAAFPSDGETPEAGAALRAAETIGRPLVNAAFIEGLERILGRRLARGRPGPAPKRAAEVAQPGLWG